MRKLIALEHISLSMALSKPQAEQMKIGAAALRMAGGSRDIPMKALEQRSESK